MSAQQDPSLFDIDEVDATTVEQTWSVAELHTALGAALSERFGDQLWVEGEIRNLKRSPKMHVYFDLIDAEQAEASYPPMLSVTLFDRERQAVNRFLAEHGGTVRISDGIRVRIKALITTYPSRSALQLRMTAIDPTFTLGVLDMARERVRATLAAENLLTANGLLPLSVAPMRIALVTSIGSAAHADVLHELESSGLGLQISVLDARVQGSDAGSAIAAAVATAQTLPVDVILLVRGGGARTDLAAFDLEIVARAIAESQLPVIVGIGHEIDRTIADEVAHSSYKTPTAAAAAVTGRINEAIDLVNSSWVRVASAGLTRLDREDQNLVSAGGRTGRSAKRHLTREAQQVDHLWRRTAITAPRTLSSAGSLLEDATRRTNRSSAQTLALAKGQLDSIAAQVRSHDPARALERGWSISRTSSGKVLRSVDDVKLGDSITTLLADGAVRSVIEERTPK